MSNSSPSKEVAVPEEWMYFKAGAYNQCSARSDPGFWYPGCGGTGDWATDKANGDYASVAFGRIQMTGSVDPKK